MLDEDGNPIEENLEDKTPENDESENENKNPEKKKAEDKPKISDAEAKALKELMKWKTQAKEAAQKAKALEDKYAGLDLEEIQKVLKEREEAETKELERKGEYDRLLAKQREAAEKTAKELQEKIKAAEDRAAELARKADELALSNSFANSKFVAEKLALTPNKTKALYGSHFEIQEGKLVAYDKPAGTPNRTPLVDASGEAVDFETAIEQIINADPDKDTLIKAVQKQGAGSKGNNVDPSKGNERVMSSLDKISEGLKKLKVEQ